MYSCKLFSSSFRNWMITVLHSFRFLLLWLIFYHFPSLSVSVLPSVALLIFLLHILPSAFPLSLKFSRHTFLTICPRIFTFYISDSKFLFLLRIPFYSHIWSIVFWAFIDRTTYHCFYFFIYEEHFMHLLPCRA